MSLPDYDPEFPWSVAQFDLGLRHAGSGKFHGSGGSLSKKGGFLIVSEDNGALKDRLGDETGPFKSYGAVFDYVNAAAAEAQASKTVVYSDMQISSAARYKRQRRVAPAPTLSRSVVLEGIVPYKWDSDEDYPQFLGQPVYATHHGMTATTNKKGVMVGLFYGFIENSTEVQLLLLT